MILQNQSVRFCHDNINFLLSRHVSNSKLRKVECWGLCIIHQSHYFKIVSPSAAFFQQLSSSTSPTWLDSFLGQSKRGVFSADFKWKNNTVLEVGDGDSVVLDCQVFLKQDKTVGVARYRYTRSNSLSPDHLVATHRSNIYRKRCARLADCGQDHLHRGHQDQVLLQLPQQLEAGDGGSAKDRFWSLCLSDIHSSSSRASYSD